MNDVPFFTEAYEAVPTPELPDLMICLHGSSDDIVEVLVLRDGEQVTHDEFYVLGHNPARFRLQDGIGAGLEVVLTFLDTSVWSAGVAQLQQDVPLPPWPISFLTKRHATAIAIGIPTLITAELVARPKAERP